jgi:RND family efflux transporter MFP subunit
MLGTLLTALAFGACEPSSASPPPSPPAVTAAPAIAREVTEWNEFTGHLEAVNAVEIRPRVSGYVQRVAFTEGADVHRGDLLFVIDPRPYRAELARAEAQLQQARTRRALAAADLARARTLVAAQAISREEFDTRASASTAGDAEVQAAEAAVETARLNLAWTEIRSPIDGRVSRAEVTVGNLAQAGPPSATLLTTVVSYDPIYLYFDTDEQTYLHYARLASPARGERRRVAAPPVYMGLVSERGFPHQGTIDFVDNRVDPVSGTIRVRAVFPNADHRFTPGLFARVKLVGNGRYTATLVQDAAVGTDQDRKFVFVVGPADTVQYRAIQLGPVIDGLRVVREGLQPGERVVINGLQRVRPGVKVAPTIAAMTPDTTAVPVETSGSHQ